MIESAEEEELVGIALSPWPWLSKGRGRRRDAAAATGGEEGDPGGEKASARKTMQVHRRWTLMAGGVAASVHEHGRQYGSDEAAAGILADGRVLTAEQNK